MGSLFQYIKENILLSDYVKSLPQASGMHSVGRNKYRCNNVLSGGSNNTSMIIDDDSGYFKMFSNGQESGDIITLYALINGESSSPKESALSLARDMGVDVPEEYLLSTGKELSRSAMISCMNSLTMKAHDYLLDSQEEDAQRVREYLENRGVDIDIISDWKLGVFPSSMSDAREMMKSCGSQDILQKVGLFGGRGGDFVSMAGRLVFPIFSTRGDTISFSSRVIPGVDTPLEDSKYINTSNTPIYNKSETLFGQHLLDKSVKKVVICEGNFDVIALNEMVDDDTVALATCGTALTTSHVSLIKKYKPEQTVIFFDSDDAGRKSTLKLVWMSNMLPNLGISSPDKGKDPWDMFSSGVYEYDISTNEPAVVTSARMASEDMSKEDFLQWFLSSYESLNFSDDREKLLSSAARYSGIRKAFLLNQVSGVKRSVRGESSRDSSSSVSASASPFVASILSFDSSQRKSVFFPLYSNSIAFDVMEMCGAESEDDEDAILIALGLLDSDEDPRLASTVWSLAPDVDDYEQLRISVSRSISLIISSEILDSDADIPSGYFPAISAISGGYSNASGLEQLSFVIDVASTLCTG